MRVKEIFPVKETKALLRQNVTCWQPCLRSVRARGQRNLNWITDIFKRINIKNIWTIKKRCLVIPENWHRFPSKKAFTFISSVGEILLVPDIL